MRPRLASQPAASGAVDAHSLPRQPSRLQPASPPRSPPRLPGPLVVLRRRCTAPLAPSWCASATAHPRAAARCWLLACATKPAGCRRLCWLLPAAFLHLTPSRSPASTIGRAPAWPSTAPPPRPRLAFSWALDPWPPPARPGTRHAGAPHLAMYALWLPQARRHQTREQPQGRKASRHGKHSTRGNVSPLLPSSVAIAGRATTCASPSAAFFLRLFVAPPAPAS